MDLNSSPSHFRTYQISHDNDHEPYLNQPFLPNFFNLTQEHTRFYDESDDQNYGGLKLGLWKKEEDENQSKRNPMKWMSSKMRVMHKMKHADHDRAARRITSSGDRTVQISSSDLSSNNSPIRVCSDCNTTKTPLWRSGPKGPKSLCNACGIRQRKARRAMAAVAAVANGATTNTGDESPVKKKLQHKGKDQNGHVSQLTKRCKTATNTTNAVGSPSTEHKQLGLEDFLMNLSKNLAFYRVFQDDEKDAAILLMALSSGIVNS